MKVNDPVLLVTEQFTDGRGINAITKHGDQLVVRTRVGKTIAKVVAIHDNGHYDLELDDGQVWAFNQVDEMICRYFYGEIIP